ncbi:MAG TPA: NAD(P)-dependent oxidoreductase [Phycisphaerae bacterium]|nr:NAD(P)-dependent oxidoreductase [Phycisphaerae bacterium]
MSKTNIAFFGLGTMGIGMVRRLLKSPDLQVTVYNRNAEKAAPLAAEGARVVRTARDAAAGADVLIAMLADDAASRGVWLGDEGALAAAKAGAVAIDCSTVTVPWVRELGGACAAKGVKFLDAPVTGTKPHAANGELTFLVGGEAAVLERVRPVLALMSKEIVHLGPVGSGAALKLINNFVCGVQLAALAEAMALMQKEGLDVKAALPVLTNGAPGSPLSKGMSTRQLTNDPTIYFALRLMAKDLTYAIEEGNHQKMELRTAAAALSEFNDAVAAGYGDQDLSAIIKYMAK